MIIKRFLLFIVIIIMVSCSNEDRSKIPNIIPSKIELSNAHPESLFQFMEGDYTMYEFRINYEKNGTEISKKITKEILSTEQTVAEPVSYTHLHHVAFENHAPPAGRHPL